MEELHNPWEKFSLSNGKILSEVGFEPTPTYVDQNTPVTERVLALESGALDRSAILTLTNVRSYI